MNKTGTLLLCSVTGWVVIGGAIASTSSFASEEIHSRTRQLTDGSSSPPATIEDVAWIAGHWRGEAFGGVVEEIWSPPLGDSMMASFKLVVDGAVKFYEIEVIREVDDSLALQLKHFHGDLKGWEEKDETVDFPLVALVEDAVYFSGMTFERISADELHVWVRIGSDDGESKEHQFVYYRVVP